MSLVLMRVVVKCVFVWTIAAAAVAREMDGMMVPAVEILNVPRMLTPIAVPVAAVINAAFDVTPVQYDRPAAAPAPMAASTPTA